MDNLKELAYKNCVDISAGQGRDAIAYLLLEAKRSYQEDLVSDAKQSMETALELYKKLDKEPPVSVQLLFGNVLGKIGDLKQALTIFHDLYIKHKSMTALIKLGYISIDLRDFSLIKQYENVYLHHIHSSLVTVVDKLHMQVIVSYLYSFTGRDTSLVQEMVDYQKVNSMILRENLKVGDYIRWIYNLHILQLLNNRSWNERAQFIYEAKSLAEQYQQHALLTNIYNLIGIGLLEENVIKAKEYMLKSRELAIKLGNKQHEMNANTNLFMFYQFLGDTSHALELADQAKSLGKTINSNFNEINLVKLYYLIEDFPRALTLINEIKPTLRSKNLTMTRVDALIYQYKIILRQSDVKKAKRLWPYFERLCKKYKGEKEVDLILLQCQYFAVLKQHEETIAISTKCLEEENISVENRLDLLMALLNSSIEIGQDEVFTKYVQSFENLVYDKGYLGYLGYVYYYKALFYLKNELYIKARVHFIRAKSYFTRVKNLLKQTEIDGKIETIDQRSLESKLEMMDLLTNYEIMFESIRLVHSAKVLEDVCKNITKVLHENLLFEHVYFYFRIDRKRTKTLSVNDKLQIAEVNNEVVDEVLGKVTREKRSIQFNYAMSYFHGFPILSDENEIVSIVLIENQSVFSKEGIYYLEQFLQYIAPKIEKVIFNELVHVDDLTKLYNRNYFMKRLQEEFQKTTDYQAYLSFIMIDIDNFRYVNNQFGHAEGDHILEKVAKTIQQSVRSGDIVGRYGGEELIVILPNTSSEIAKVVAQRILHEIRKIFVNDTYQITASIGVSSVDRDVPITIQELIDKADLAERYAKENGKNQVVSYWEM
ncbi:GGDEF domain-containing protein [Anaerobacillus alkaliphilus]|uniref:GGDEF domain-containing protein n=1 Tax=Anaerobacillus alkaliphilus TaxID=1548597 RepID=A0A4Q0VL80_9BACI|nr:GGDEF domain-containing protein [Anaerobacillus alkaliphilus]RXI96227.1 GGDEF domain-containing protein [Anaerobacillus alkaliphilus]